jgi:hypothetical protein
MEQEAELSGMRILVVEDEFLVAINPPDPQVRMRNQALTGGAGTA